MTMHWSDDYEDENEKYNNWVYSTFHVSAEEMNAIYQRAIKAFDAACDKEEDRQKVDRLLHDILGHRTYEITGD